ncbi:hypothetical protein [Mesorhizobium mediterraneum]|uniref:hypothetical protein n=1 Tax=Mesorhizobium mediterraneum TaxID=43617 RepID=UPI001782C889|nr:hypothetical protein [Mesorhizobium mediterraneum]
MTASQVIDFVIQVGAASRLGDLFNGMLVLRKSRQEGGKIGGSRSSKLPIQSQAGEKRSPLTL